MFRMAKPVQQPKFRIKLNLLHPNEIPPPLPARFLKWLIAYGRYVVILTQVVVVTAFVYRFKLDADLDQLKRQINKSLPYVEGLAADEALIKQTHLRLATIQKINDATPDWEFTIKNFASEQPRSIIIVNLSFQIVPNQPDVPFKASGVTPSNNDLAVFIRRLKDKKDDKGQAVFKNVVLDTLNFDQAQLVFTLSGLVKKND